MSCLYVTENGASISVEGGYFVVHYPRTAMVKKIPKEAMEYISIFGNVGLTTPCYKECLKRGIPVTFYSTRGAYFGRLESTRHQNIGRVKRQLYLTEDVAFCKKITARILDAKIHNQIVLLRRYSRNNETKVQGHIKKMSTLSHGILDRGYSVQELIGYEGMAARIYFEALSLLIREEFAFQGRSRQPPKDPFNSLLSLGYTLLMYEIYGVLESAGLNPYGGFIHSDRDKHPTLASDLMEEWRAVIVDAVVFSLIQGKEIALDQFVVNEETGGVYLEKDGMKIFIEKMEKKFRSETGYLDSSYRMSYRRALKHQVNQLVLAIEREEPEVYVPIRIK